MPGFEYLRMTELLNKFRSDIICVQETRSVKDFKQANLDLQEVYNYHVSTSKSFSRVEDFLRNLYTSFNYLAVIVNDIHKKKHIENERVRMLDEGLEFMIKSCDEIIALLNKKPEPPKPKKKK